MPTEKSRGLNPALYTPLAIILAGALVGVGVFFGLARGGVSGGAMQGAQEPLVTTKADMQKLVQTNRTPALIDTANAKQGGPRFIGKANASLTIDYWFDYQCPFCKQFEESVLPDLVDKYVNTGKAKIVFHDFAFLGQDSVIAGEYSRAIWDLYPDKFYLWHQAMFDVQDAEGDQGFGDAATIETLTSLIPGIDVSKVHARVAQMKDTYDAAMAADQKAGADKGVQGTPGFRFGKQSIDGAEPVANFEQAIDSELK